MENNVKKIIEQISNIDKPLPKSADILEQLEKQTSNVIRASLKDWQDAYEYAKDVDSPDRQELLEIYETLEIDTHITAITETIYQGIASMDFVIKNSNDENDIELIKLFKTKWFNEWLAISIESIFWGFSGVQYGPIKDDKFQFIKDIPRYNIRPDQNGIVSNQNDNKLKISFDDEPYKSWTTLIYPRMFGDQYKLGKYNKIAKWFILKREVTQFWAIFNELFGHPFRVTKTAIKDNVKRQNAINAMESMTTAAYAVIDLEDEIEFITPSSGAGYNTFKDFIEVADKQMSKALIGSTMVLDEGSSRSQGEVHKQNTNAFIVGYANMIQYLINDELIPKMSKLGISITSDDKFEYQQIEKLSKKEWAEIISKIGTIYDIPIEDVVESIGLNVEEKIIQLPTQTDVQELENKSMFSFLNSNKNKVVDFYKKNFK